MKPSNNLENKTPSGTYWKVQLVCKKVQADSFFLSNDLHIVTYNQSTKHLTKNNMKRSLSPVKMMKARKSPWKNNMQNIWNSKNNITKRAFFWIGQDVVLDWNRFKKDSLWSIQIL